MEKKLALYGRMSIGTGCIVILLSLFPRTFFYAIALSFLGFIFSNLYIATNSRYKINPSLITPGIIGLILNSVPLLFIFIIKFIAPKL